MLWCHTTKHTRRKENVGNQEGQRKLPVEHRGDLDVGRRKRIKGGEGDGDGREEEHMSCWQNFVNGKKRNERHVSENESCVGEGEERASNSWFNLKLAKKNPNQPSSNPCNSNYHTYPNGFNPNPI